MHLIIIDLAVVDCREPPRSVTVDVVSRGDCDKLLVSSITGSEFWFGTPSWIEGPRSKAVKIGLQLNWALIAMLYCVSLNSQCSILVLKVFIKST